MNRRDGLWGIIIICSAFLAVGFTPAIVGRSLAVFVLVSVVCWGAIFGGTVALGRSISRRDRAE